MEIEKFLVESALLTHGLSSITNEKLVEKWNNLRKNIVWVDRGNIVFGDINEFVLFRNRSNSLIRIDCFTLKEAIENKLSGALTASGTMQVCNMNGIKLAVTCGMGGIGDIKGETLCPDLPALRDIPVCLISTSPKDMLDIKETLGWLKKQDVRILATNEAKCTGYVFNSSDVNVDGVLDLKNVNLDRGKLLILNSIPNDKRILDLNILDIAIKEGKKAEMLGKYYHPAVNKKIDKLTKGYSSYIQLQSIIDNIELAERITK